MTASRYLNRIRRLPRGLTFTEGARRLGISYQKGRRLMQRAGYPAVDGRKYSQHAHRKFVPEDADWSKSNIALAREWGVTRERVRSLRAIHRKPFVESRGRPAGNGKKHFARK